jgi:glutathione peroxidase
VAETFGVTFSLFSKVRVNGRHALPLWRYLRAQKSSKLMGNQIKWNFTKFLVDRSGKVVSRHAPVVAPLKLERNIVRLLDELPTSSSSSSTLPPAAASASS